MPSRSSQDQFDRQASFYNAEWNTWNQRSLVWMKQRSGCLPSHRLLDVATGAGFTAIGFAPLVAEVVGVDVSAGMLDQARKRAEEDGCANVSFQSAPAESLPFPDASFDLVTSRVAPHHFLSIPKFASEAFRVLRAGGRLIVADTAVPDAAPAIDAWLNHIEVLRDPSHVRNCSPSEWRAFVSAAGFVVEEIEELTEPEPIRMNSWLEKAGCRGDAAAEVRRLFLEAPPDAVRLFRIEPQPGGDIAFQHLRLALSARKPASRQ